jgi:hypothetical protein
MERADRVPTRSEGVKDELSKSERLAQYTHKKLMKKQERLMQLHKLHPQLYKKPVPLEEMTNSRLAPTVKKLIKDHPHVIYNDNVNIENEIPEIKKAKNSKNGLIASIFRKSKKKVVMGDNPVRQPLSPMRVSNNSSSHSVYIESEIIDRTATTTIISGSGSSSGSGYGNNCLIDEQKQVQNVLDLLLEENQVTPALYRRMSTQRLTISGMQRRLSVIPPSSLGSDGGLKQSKDIVLHTVKQYIEDVESSWDNDFNSYLASATGNSSNATISVGDALHVTTSDEDVSLISGDKCDEEYCDNMDVSILREEEPSSRCDIDNLIDCEKHLHANNDPVLISTIGASSGDSNDNKKELRIITDRGDVGETEILGNGGGTWRYSRKKDQNDADENSGSDDGVGENSEDDNDPAIKDKLLSKCLDWYLRQGVVSLRIDRYLIWNANKLSTPLSAQHNDDNDGRRYINYELRLTCAGHDDAKSSKGFKMMSLKRFTAFDLFYEELKKAFNDENIKNIGSSSYTSALAINQAFSDAIRMSTSSYGLAAGVGNRDGITRSKGGRLQLAIPHLPPKRMISSFGRWKDPAFLDQRQEMLRKWIEAVLPLQAYQTIDLKGSPSKGLRPVDNPIRRAFRSFLIPENMK